MQKGLILFIGECFREGASCSRLKDTDFGIKNQTECSHSHVKLIDKLSLTYHIDVAINTYTTSHKDLLLSFYNNIIYSNFTTEDYGELRYACKHSINNIFNIINNYKFIFICRLDVKIKDPLIHLFNPEWKTIVYPNVMSLTDHYLISDLFCFIPCKYFNAFGTWNGLLPNSDKILNPTTINILLKSGLTIEDFDFMTEMCYIANTIQMSNPLYAINCRPEGPVWCNMKYDKILKKVI